jgi:hypothetical protein
VNIDSIVRKIWGSADTILFIFAGSAVEFALNKAVDWLYFTGRLPADPIGRMFSTVSYARQIVFSEEDKAVRDIQEISSIHREVERKRGCRIPSEAYLDVLFMLIDYSIRAFELLERKLTSEEKEEVFSVFHRQGVIMELEGLPDTYSDWLTMRKAYLEKNLENSALTADLFKQYKKHLGNMRYFLLLRVQAMLAPAEVRLLLPNLRPGVGPLLLGAYKLARLFKLAKIARNGLLPARHQEQVAELDVVRGKCPFHATASRTASSASLSSS